MKPLPALFGALPGIAGASIQANGGILLMIDAASIIGIASGCFSHFRQNERSESIHVILVCRQHQSPGEMIMEVLVVDDSKMMRFALSRGAAHV